MTITTTVTPSDLVTGFVHAFAQRRVSLLEGYLHPDVVFEAYGDTPVKGRDAVLRLWGGVFGQFARVEFTTLHQAAEGDVVIAEQVYGLGLPGRALVPIRNVAVYRVQDGQIVEWRDYSNPEYASTLM
jgi:limonene-1,2-epoxide hydrolase